MSARISSSSLNVMAGYCARLDLDLSLRMVAEGALRHVPGENVEPEPAGADRRVAVHQLPRLLDRGSEYVDATQRLVGLAGQWSSDEGVAFGTEAGVIRHMSGLQPIELLFAHVRRVGRPPEKGDGVDVELHAGV